MQGLSIGTRKRSLTNFSPLLAHNTPRTKAMKKVNVLREYIMGSEHVDQAELLEIFDGSAEELKAALNTVYYEGDSYNTVFMEYCSEITVTDLQKLANQTQVLDTLLALGANINLCNTKDGQCTPGDFEHMNALLWAMTNGKIPLVEFLANRGGVSYENEKMMVQHFPEEHQEEIMAAFRRGSAGFQKQVATATAAATAAVEAAGGSSAAGGDSSAAGGSSGGKRSRRKRNRRRGTRR